jgi:hypothetical protein
MIGRLSHIKQRREALLGRSAKARQKISRHFADCESVMGPVDLVYRGFLFTRANPVLTAGLFALATRLLGGFFLRRRGKPSAAAVETERGPESKAASIPVWIGRLFTGIRIARQILNGLQRIR